MDLGYISSCFCTVVRPERDKPPVELANLVANLVRDTGYAEITV